MFVRHSVVRSFCLCSGYWHFPHSIYSCRQSKPFDGMNNLNENVVVCFSFCNKYDIPFKQCNEVVFLVLIFFSSGNKYKNIPFKWYDSFSCGYVKWWIYNIPLYHFNIRVCILHPCMSLARMRLTSTH